MSSLRVLGSVGEPINPEAWLWYRKYIGGDRCPIVDTWWQTETGAIMISPLPGVTTLEPGSAQKPIPGISAEILDDEGHPFTEAEKVGYLVLTKPWPSMLRGIWGDPTATATPTGAGSARSTTSPATVRSTTPTETSGCSAGSMTS
jgi:acetyl-CoA synthetase